MGAISLLEFQRNSGQGNETTDLWIGYCAFHGKIHQIVSPILKLHSVNLRIFGTKMNGVICIKVEKT